MVPTIKNVQAYGKVGIAAAASNRLDDKDLSGSIGGIISSQGEITTDNNGQSNNILTESIY